MNLAISENFGELDYIDHKKVVSFPLILSVPFANNTVMAVGKLPTPLVAGAEIYVDREVGSKPFMGASLSSGGHRWAVCLISMAGAAPEDADKITIHQNGVQIDWIKAATQPSMDVFRSWMNTLDNRAKDRILLLFSKYISVVPAVCRDPKVTELLRDFSAEKIHFNEIGGRIITFEYSKPDSENIKLYQITGRGLIPLSNYVEISDSGKQVAALLEGKIMKNEGLKLLVRKDNSAEIIQLFPSNNSAVVSNNFAIKAATRFKDSLENASETIAQLSGVVKPQTVNDFSLAKYNFYFNDGSYWFSAEINDPKSQLKSISLKSHLGVEAPIQFYTANNNLIFAYGSIDIPKEIKDIFLPENLELEFNINGIKMKMMPENLFNTSFLLNHIYNDIFPAISFDVQKEETCYQSIKWIQSKIPSIPKAANELQFGAANAEPKFSLIIPLFGNMDYVAYQLAFFSNDPSMQNGELIYVIDDASNAFLPSLRNLYNVYGYGFKVLVMGQNYGQARAINTGISKAASDTIILMDSDVMPIDYAWSERLIAASKETSNSFVCPVMLYEDGTVQNAGYNIKDGNIFERSRGGIFSGISAAKTNIGAVNAACTVFSKYILPEGAFPSDYLGAGMAIEEQSSKCKENKLLHEVAVYHMEKQSSRYSNAHVSGAALWYNQRRLQEALNKERV
jgi:hypothetical protein